MTGLHSPRLGRFRPDLFRVLGVAWVVSGGLVAAATGPLRLEHGSWAAAYQVLVAGVAQNAFGAAQRALAPQRLTFRIVAAELVAWNVGSAAVIGGTVARTPLVVDAGGLLLVVALALMIRTVRGKGEGPQWALWTYRILLAVILISIPIGLTLAHLRAA
ncbi:hypothetical protein IV500_16865 [Paeniglutamicibacter antarcticus]|uniref:Uncharacterized protein n=1 Tax=Arthrobacter terrae TaxID=2935737 RepID=A0A931CUA2_9MICC|nr:hypothetical protein [Arthrobacter terrae]MBG0741046.1 hypothetical protein [Arthrobacter terrae]